MRAAIKPAQSVYQATGLMRHIQCVLGVSSAASKPTRSGHDGYRVFRVCAIESGSMGEIKKKKTEVSFEGLFT